MSRMTRLKRANSGPIGTMRMSITLCWMPSLTRSSWWIVSNRSFSELRAWPSVSMSLADRLQVVAQAAGLAPSAAVSPGPCVFPSGFVLRRSSFQRAEAPAENCSERRLPSAAFSRRPIWAKRALLITSWPARFINSSSRSMSTRKVSVGLALSAARLRPRPRAPRRFRRGGRGSQGPPRSRGRRTCGGAPACRPPGPPAAPRPPAHARNLQPLAEGFRRLGRDDAEGDLPQSLDFVELLRGRLEEAHLAGLASFS